MGILNAKCTSTARLDGKTVVITGCNTGIGKECVKDFYLRGGKIIMACRDLQKAQATREEIQALYKDQPNLGSMHLVKLDLTSLKSVRYCAKKIITTEDKIDILLNNAGIMICPYSTTEDDFEIQFGTNHLGHFLLTLLLLPKIIASDSQPARIVNVASLGHILGWMNFDDLNWKTRRYNSIAAYGQTKLANILFTKELSRQLQDAGIHHVHTYALHPGIIKTELGRHLNDSMFWGSTNFFNAITTKTPVEGAQTSIYCCVSEDCAQETGLYYRECEKAWCAGRARNEIHAKRLWDESLKLTGLGEHFNINRSYTGVKL